MTSHCDQSESSALAALAEAYPWPETKPEVPESSWGWGIAGEDLLRSFIPSEATVVLEVGSLLGASARFFARHCPSAHLICVDPWFDVDDPKDRPFLSHAPELTRFVTEEKDGIYQIFLASNWELRHRLTPLRGFSPDMLAPVHAHGIQPAAVYIDGSHVYEDVLSDITTARTLFPGAVLCGDDWKYWPGVQHAVNYFARNRGDTIHTADNTWLLEAGQGSERFSAPSAKTVGPVRHSLPVRVAKQLLGRIRNR